MNINEQMQKAIQEEVYGAEAVALMENYKPYLDAVRSVNEGYSTEEAYRLAVCLQNTQTELDYWERRAKGGLLESTQVADVGMFKKYAMDILKHTIS